jgi:AraC-like DNA-binding protein
VQRRDRYTVPASHGLQLLELLDRWGIAPQALLEGSGLTEAFLQDPSARLSIEQLGALMERTRQLTDEPGIGIHLALQKRATLYGNVGLASMHAATLGEALELAIRFAPVVTNVCELALRAENDTVALTLEERCDFGPSRDVMLLSFLLGLATIGSTLTGREFSGWVHFAIPEPAYSRRFAAFFGNVRFGEPMHQLVFPKADLASPIERADAAAVRLAREHCERDMLALGVGDGLSQRIRRAMFSPRSGWSLDGVAATLGMSTRTLKRRCAEEQITFSELRERVRCERALLLLRSPQTGLDELAEGLGYATASSFVRAFRRWTGKTPIAYRRMLSGEQSVDGTVTGWRTAKSRFGTSSSTDS